MKPKLATVWLDGCSGCHMSLLDMDLRLLDLAGVADVVYSPLVDRKEFPPDVDVTLVEGAISTVDDLAKIRHIRARTRTLVSLGDCAVTGNVPALRNLVGVRPAADRAYVETADAKPGLPTQRLPTLLDRVHPVHEVVAVDVFVPGCPPPADTIFAVVSDLLAGRTPDVSAHTRFGR